MASEMVVTETSLTGLELVARGKVRDIYRFGDSLLIVSTDRLSAFDVVLPDGIPDKGKVLNQLSRFWFDKFRDVIPNHMITSEPTAFYEELERFRPVLVGRSMLVRRAKPLPVECVVRGYLAGSAWKEYSQTGRVGSYRLPQGLRQADELPEPLFTPSTKAQSGHDEGLTVEQFTAMVGEGVARLVIEASLEIYTRACNYARRRGIIIADTKFEFGLIGNEVVLIDELLTPDSSRFWSQKEYQPGGSPPSFDKQFVRDYLEALGWDKRPPAPQLPLEVIAGTASRYREVFRLLTGQELA